MKALSSLVEKFCSRLKVLSNATNADADVPSRHTTLFNVVLRLILGRDVEQQIFNVDTTLLTSTLGKQPILTLFHCQISTLTQR